MKKILTILLLLCAYASFGQGGYIRQNTTYGIVGYRYAFDSTLLIPVRSGAPVNIVELRSTNLLRKAGLIADTTNKKMYIFWPTDSTWSEISLGGGSGAINFFDIVNVDSTGMRDGYIPYYDSATGNILFQEPGAPVSISVNSHYVEDSTNTPPVSFPVGSDTLYYLVGGAGTGIFSGNNYKIAMYVNEVFDSFITPSTGDYAITLDDAVWHRYNGTTWPVTYARPLINGGNFGGAIYGTTNAGNAWMRYNNQNRIILSSNGVQFPSLTGTGLGLAQFSATGLLQRRQPVASSDTTANKPMAQATDGTIYRMESWPGGGGAGSGLSNVYAPLVKSGDTVHQRFNILHYGAIADDDLDDTGPVQAAINAANAAGGGDVIVPTGVFDILGPILTTDGTNPVDSAQIYIPWAAWSSASKTHIRIIGEAKPNEFTSRGQTVQVSKGSVLRSKSNSTYGRVFGNAYNTSDGLSVNFNEITFENLNIKVRSKTSGGTDTAATMTGLGLNKSMMLNVLNCVINTESAQADGVEPAPTSIGIELPGNGNWTRQVIENCTIDNFYTGLKCSEHTFTKNLYVATCFNGIDIQAGYHSASFQKTLIQWCVNGVKISGQAYFNFDNLDIEAYSTLSGNPSKWYLPSLDIYEPSTTSSRGVIHFKKTISNGATGDAGDATFTVSGTLSPAVEYRTVDDFYARFGANTSSPQRQLHVMGASGPVDVFPTLGAEDYMLLENKGNANFGLITTTTGIGALKWYESGATAQRGTIQYDLSAEQFDFYTNAGATSRFSISSAGNIATSSGATFNAGAGKLVLDAAGLVGINSATPVRQLHVTGAGTPTDPVSLGAADYIYMESTGNASISINSGTSSIGGIKFWENGQSGTQKGAIFYDQSTDQFRIATNAVDAATTSNVVITSAGDVGINTGTAANSKFQNSGSISPGAYRSITAGRTIEHRSM